VTDRTYDRVRSSLSKQGTRLPFTRPLSGPERAKVKPAMRRAVYDRDGWRCRACQRNLREPHAFATIDHILPIIRGGKSVMENLQTLCRKCNASKGANVYPVRSKKAQ
jgi:5-methylcytosine-specific restriction endonuclease McrA